MAENVSWCASKTCAW